MVEDTAKTVPERLMDAAEKLFCDKGYEATSVRDLTTTADCNIASVNYHFGGKDKLYKAMFQRHLKYLAETQVQNVKKIMASANPTLEELLKIVSQTALAPLKTGSGKGSMTRLLVREILNPHLSEELIPQDMFAEIEKLFIESITKLTPGLDFANAILARFSYDGVLTHSLLFTEFYYKIYPDMTFDELIEHIVKFSCAGIRSFANGK
jgi:AcrR family transcriptional regulator